MSTRYRSSLFWRLHPIWRGIGLLLLVLIPFIAYGFSGMLLDYIVDRSPDLPQNPNQIIMGVDNLYLQIGVTLILAILFYLIITLIASAIYSLSGAREREDLFFKIGSGRRK